MTTNRHRLTIDPTGSWFKYLDLVPAPGVVLGTAHLGDDGPPGALVMFPGDCIDQGISYPFRFALMTRGTAPWHLVTRKALAALAPLAADFSHPLLTAYLARPADFEKSPLQNPGFAITKSENRHSEIRKSPLQNPATRSVGRPALAQEGKRVNVYLDAPSLERARLIGRGNVSEGIRLALESATAPKD